MHTNIHYTNINININIEMIVKESLQIQSLLMLKSKKTLQDEQTVGNSRHRVEVK